MTVTSVSPEVRWWRHPVALAAFHLQAVAFGLAAGVPLAARMAETLGPFAGLDATLFDDGGVLLADLIRAWRDPWRGVLAVTSIVLLLGGLARLVATTALLVAMASRSPAPWRRTLRALPGVWVLVVSALALQLLTAALLGSLAAPLVGLAAPGTPHRDLAAGIAASLAMAVVAVVSVLRDLATASFVGAGRGLLASVARALRALREAPGALFAAFAMRRLTTFFLLITATILAMQVGMRSSVSAWTALLLLEGALLAGTCLRASWLGVALGAVLPEPRTHDLLDDLADDAGTALPDAAVSSTNSAAEPR